jgi:PPOX class probable F420-dependent enzyme
MTRADLTPRAIELLKGKNFGALATLMPDGAPQVTIVWVDTDGRDVIFNTAEGRQKMRNLRQNERVSLAVIDQENPYSFVEIRGRVAGMTHEGAVESIHELHRKYHGSGQHSLQPNEQRVLIRIEPERVSEH